MHAQEYKIIAHSDIQKFVNWVNELIADGWTPQGGVSTLTVRAGNMPATQYTQAMIKPEEPGQVLSGSNEPPVIHASDS